MTCFEIGFIRFFQIDFIQNASWYEEPRNQSGIEALRKKTHNTWFTLVLSQSLTDKSKISRIVVKRSDLLVDTF